MSRKIYYFPPTELFIMVVAGFAAAWFIFWCAEHDITSPAQFFQYVNIHFQSK